MTSKKIKNPYSAFCRDNGIKLCTLAAAIGISNELMLFYVEREFKPVKKDLADKFLLNLKSKIETFLKEQNGNRAI